jgi:hypothetical protein
MKLLPALTVDLASDLPPAELLAALRGIVGPGPDAAFAGSVGADGFLVTWVNDYRAAHLPRLRGRLSPAAGGTVVHVRLRPHPAVLLLMAMWLLFLAAAAGIVAAAREADPSRSLLPLLLPAGAAALSWLLMAAVFAADARWALERLRERTGLRVP